MYKVTFNIAVFLASIFFLNAESASKKDLPKTKKPHNYETQDALIRYNQLDHANRVSKNPVSDPELLDAYYTKKNSKFRSKESPASLFCGNDQAVLSNALHRLKQMNNLNFILNWPKERQTFAQIDIYKPVIKKLDYRFIMDYRDAASTITIDENNNSKIDDPEKNSHPEVLDLDLLQKRFFDNWSQGVEYLFSRDNDHDKAFPFLNAAVNVDNGYYSKGTIAALYKLTDSLDKTLLLLKGKVSFILMDYYKNKQQLTGQELDWCFLYNKLLFTNFKEDSLGVNTMLCSQFKHPKSLLFDVAFNNEFEDKTFIMRSLINGASLHKSDEEYRQKALIEKVKIAIKQEMIHSLDYLWPAIFFAQSAYANKCINGLFNNKERNGLFDHLNPIVFHNEALFSMYLDKSHINSIKVFLGENIVSHQHKLLLTLCTIFNVMRSFRLKETADSCQDHKDLNNENQASQELNECCKGAYKKALLTIFSQCNLKMYSNCNQYNRNKSTIEKWLESLKNTIGSFLSKNDLLLWEDIEKRPEIGYRHKEVLKLMSELGGEESLGGGNARAEGMQNKKILLKHYENVYKKEDELGYLGKVILLINSARFRKTDQRVKDLLSQSVGLLTCSPVLYCQQIVHKKFVYPYYVVRLGCELKKYEKYYTRLVETERQSTGDLEKDDRDPDYCMILALLGTSIDPNFRCYFANDIKEHYNKVKDVILHITDFLIKNNGFDVFYRQILDRVVTSMEYIAQEEKGMEAILGPIVEGLNKELQKSMSKEQSYRPFKLIDELASICCKPNVRLFNEVKKKLPSTKTNSTKCTKKKK